MSIRRSHGGRRSSSARTSPVGSGPPSTRSRRPVPLSTRIPSPCPTSRTVTLTTPVGRSATARPSAIVAAARATAATRGPRRRWLGIGARRPARAGAAGPDEGGAAGAPRLRRERNSGNQTAIALPRRAITATSAAETRAATMSHGAPSVTLANGSPAPIRTTPTIEPSNSHAGRPPRVATIAGMPAPIARPATTATAPAAIPGATSGTTARFTTGDTSESRPNDRRITGSVAACAASETPSDSASHARRRPGEGPASRAASGVPQAIRPAVAMTDRRNPASSM